MPSDAASAERLCPASLRHGCWEGRSGLDPGPSLEGRRRRCPAITRRSRKLPACRYHGPRRFLPCATTACETARQWTSPEGRRRQRAERKSTTSVRPLPPGSVTVKQVWHGPPRLSLPRWLPGTPAFPRTAPPTEALPGDHRARPARDRGTCRGDLWSGAVPRCRPGPLRQNACRSTAHRHETGAWWPIPSGPHDARLDS